MVFEASLRGFDGHANMALLKVACSSAIPIAFFRNFKACDDPLMKASFAAMPPFDKYSDLAL
jgi:hypothetical protein